MRCSRPVCRPEARCQIVRAWRQMLRVSGPLLLVSVSITGTASAAAEPIAAERAIAERLFDRGRRQLADGDTKGACDSFAESRRLDPGVGVLLNLAACQERMGRLASAWVELREALVMIRRQTRHGRADGQRPPDRPDRPDRLRYVTERLAAIEPRLAFVTIEVPAALPEAPEPIVTLDGQPLGRPAWGVNIPVDAGVHEITAHGKAGAGRSWRDTVTVRDGERYSVTVPASLAADGDGPAGALGARASGDAVPKLEPEASGAAAGPNVRCGLSGDETPYVARRPTREPGGEAAMSMSGRRVAGWMLGAVGTGAIGVGIAFGIRAAALWSDRNRACPMEACSSEGLSLGEQAHFSAAVSTWTLAAGGAALGGAALMLLLPVRRMSPNGPAVGRTNAEESLASSPTSPRATDPLSLLRHLRIHSRGIAVGGTF